MAEGPPPAPEPAALEGPALEEGPPDRDEARLTEAAELLERADQALEAEDYSEALRLSDEIENRLGRVPGTARALWIRSRAHAGREAWSDADEAVSRFLTRLDEDDPEVAEATLFRARLRVEAALPGDVEALFDIPEDAPGGVLDEGEELARQVARTLDLSGLRDLIREAPRHPRILPVFQVELAVRRALLGDRDAALDLVDEALALAPGASTRERARRVRDDELEELEREVLVLGGILSEEGPPSLRELSARIREGIEVALVEMEQEGLPIRLQALDDEGSTDGAARALRRLEEDAVVGIVGPLVDETFASAARARQGPLPMISPTVRLLPQDVPNVLSLTGVDPAAPRALARLALDAGVREVVILHPRTTDMTEQAQTFVDAFQGGGGVVRQRLTYAPGNTNFEEPFEEVVRLEPDGLVLLLPPEDVEQVAPQVAFYEVNEMEITILGSEAWSSEDVLQRVNPRHTEGVLTVTSRTDPDGFGPRWDRFVEGYESHFQRTLRSPLPALGYDAALLLLHAAREADGSAEGTARALENVRGFEGATGVLDVVDGRIQRSYQPVRIEDRRSVPFRP